MSLLRHVCRRRKIGLLNVLQLADQRLLRRATRAGIPLDCALVDHDGEGEAGMTLRFCHHKFGGVVFAVVGTVPVNDHAVDAAADHVGDLLMNLPGVGGVVANVHVVRSSEPHHHVCIDLGGRARIQQRVQVHFADISGASIAIRLFGETVRGTRIVGRLIG